MERQHNEQELTCGIAAKGRQPKLRGISAITTAEHDGRVEMYRRGWVVFFLFSMVLINYIDRITLSFAIIPISKEMHIDNVTKGYLFSSFLWTYTLALIPIGFLVDRYGGKRVAAWGIAVWSFATVLTGAATGMVTLMASRLLMGGSEASSNPSGARIIREWIPAGERGVINAAFNGGAYAGPALCAIVAGPIVEIWGWRALFIVTGALGFIWLIAWLVFYTKPESARWLSAEERSLILAERDTGKTRIAAPSTEPAGLLRLMCTKTLWGVALTQGCNVYCQYFFLTWLPSYLRASKHLSLVTTGLYTAIPYGGAVLLCLAIGWISDRLLMSSGTRSGRRRNMIALAMVVAALVMLAPLVDNVWILLALITISLTGVASTTSLNFALLNDLLPNPGDVGKAMAFLVVGGNTFGLIAPIATGYVVARTGDYVWAFVTAGILLLAGAIAALTLTRKPMTVGAASAMRGAGQAGIITSRTE